MKENSIINDLTLIAQTLYDKKGFNILILDVRHISTMTDYFIIAEGTVDRHVKALSHTIINAFEMQKRFPLHVEGQQEGDWVVLDYGELVIHLFVPELRQKYALEELWHKGSIVDVKIDTSEPETKN